MLAELQKKSTKIWSTKIRKIEEQVNWKPKYRNSEIQNPELYRSWKKSTLTEKDKIHTGGTNTLESKVQLYIKQHLNSKYKHISFESINKKFVKTYQHEI